MLFSNEHPKLQIIEDNLVTAESYKKWCINFPFEDSDINKISLNNNWFIEGVACIAKSGLVRRFKQKSKMLDFFEYTEKYPEFRMKKKT